MENSIIKKYKISFFTHCIIGLTFFLLALAEGLNIIDIVENNKILGGMAILALGASGAQFLYFYMIKKNSPSVQPIIVAESDERNIAVKNEAEAKTFSVLKIMIFYIYFAYTFLFPEEIFVSFGWWSVTIIFMTSVIMSGLIFFFVNKKY